MSGRYWVFMEGCQSHYYRRVSQKPLGEVFCKSGSPAPNVIALSGGRRKYFPVGLAKRSLFLTPPESTTPFGTSVLLRISVTGEGQSRSRHGSRLTQITNQIPIKQWHESIGDATLADAILNRLLHNSH